MLGEAFRRRGYAVQENRYAGADGGIDLVLTRDGGTYLVQAKQWRGAKVGVKVVREMLGLVTAHRAAGTIIVTSGVFTQEAQRFAVSQPIDLVAGGELAAMVRSVQKDGFVAREVTHRSNDHRAAPARMVADARACPLCGGNLILRTAKRGFRAGESFWGCTNFPRCKHTEQKEA
ncbi:MAG: restriction endonuclease [Rhodopirellula sp.]|nr:restriction endonuclease [Rhodopirellula sp.]